MLKKILMGLGALFLLFIIIGVASGGDENGSTSVTDSSGDTASEEPQTSDSDTSGDEVAEEAVEPEKEPKKGPMTFGNWEVQGKIQPKADALGDFEAAFRVKNISDAPDAGFFTVSILKGNNIWATMDCSTSEIGPDQVGTAECISTDKFRRGWSEISIENAF